MELGRWNRSDRNRKFVPAENFAERGALRAKSTRDRRSLANRRFRTPANDNWCGRSRDSRQKQSGETLVLSVKTKLWP